MKSHPAPKLTPARRAANKRNTDKRYATMLAAARRDGFIKASSAVTAWMSGTHVLVAIEVAQEWKKQDK